MAVKKPIYKTAYTGHVRKHCSSGSPIKNEYEYEKDELGRKRLVVTGTTNVYEMIQAALPETKLENVLARAIAGDTSMLRPDGGVYADTTKIPNNLIESMQAIQKLENTWKKLDTKTKEKYHNDVEYFVGQAGSEEWLRDMGYLSKDAEAVAAAVTTDTGKEAGTVKEFGEVGKNE